MRTGHPQMGHIAIARDTTSVLEGCLAGPSHGSEERGRYQGKDVKEIAFPAPVGPDELVTSGGSHAA
jgi:hypothetical protein